jgi:uncharacterized membrane protein (UPF0127 family)
VEIRNLTRATTLATKAGLAATSRERRRGLLGRDRLGEEEGLWIVPCEAVHTFGMKFPIDAVFLSRSYRVLKIRENLPPRRLALCWRAHSVLELPAGTVRRTGTTVGDQLALSR